MNLLLNDKYAPITNKIGFFEAPPDVVAKAYVDWIAPLKAKHQIYLETHTVKSSDLIEAVQTLLPLVNVETTRLLFMPTQSPWTALISNHHRGLDRGPVKQLPKRIGCRSVFIVAIPNTIQKNKGNRGRYGMVSFSLNGPTSDEVGNNTVRIISVANDGGRWDWNTFGEPLSFEDVEQYNARQIKDRFTIEMVRIYAAELGIYPFEENFYLPPENGEAILVEKVGNLYPNIQSFSLEEVQARF